MPKREHYNPPPAHLVGRPAWLPGCRAYFTEGRDISNRQVLADVVVESGLDRQLVESMLNSDEGVDAIRNAEELARHHGVSGVPFFIFNGKVALSGAQSPETFVEAFKQSAE